MKRGPAGNLEEEFKAEHDRSDCEICFVKYNSTDKKPLNLNCGHAYCKGCL